jgi:hypothetical protein
LFVAFLPRILFEGICADDFTRIADVLEENMKTSEKRRKLVQEAYQLSLQHHMRASTIDYAACGKVYRSLVNRTVSKDDVLMKLTEVLRKMQESSYLTVFSMVDRSCNMLNPNIYMQSLILNGSLSPAGIRVVPLSTKSSLREAKSFWHVSSIYSHVFFC